VCQYNSYSQVRPLHIFIMEEAVGCSFQGDAAVFHDLAPVGDLEGHIGVLLHQEDGRPAFLIDSSG
jgi:hypothetical protein